MANNFTDDANCVALYRFENGALTTDSKGSNTLTDVNTVASDTTNYKEGSGSADFEYSNGELFYRTDANLSADFPGKSGTTNQTFSVCGWFKLESIPANNAAIVLVSKLKWWETTISDSWVSWATAIWVDSGGVANLQLGFGYNAGKDSEFYEHATALSTGVWYHFTCSYNNSTKAYAIRLRDTDGAVVGTDLAGTATLDANKLSCVGGPLRIGAWGNEVNNNWEFFDGLIDEVVIFGDVILSPEATSIAKGIYGQPNPTPYDSVGLQEYVSNNLMVEISI